MTKKYADTDINQEFQRVENIVIKFAENPPERILALVKVVFEVDSEYEFIIKSIDKPQEIVVKAISDADKIIAAKKSIVPHLAKAEKSIEASSWLLNKVTLLNIYAQGIDRLIEFHFPPEETFFSKINTARLFSISAPKTNAPKSPKESDDGNKLRELAEIVRQESANVFNNREILDEDSNATPRTLLSIQRIRAYITNLPDDNARLIYLKKMKRAYLENDDRALCYVADGRKVLRAQPTYKNQGNERVKQTFFDALQSEIDFYSEICGLPDSKAKQTLEISNESNKESEKKSINEKKTQDYPPYRRKELIDAAVHLTKKSDSWKETDLIEKLGISESTLTRLKRFFHLKIRDIRNEALEIIENESD